MTYIIAYVKTQKIRFIIHYVKPTALPGKRTLQRDTAGPPKSTRYNKAERAPDYHTSS